VTAVRSLLPALFIAAAFTSAVSGQTAGPKLAYVVILSRHGVRSPLATPEALSQYAAESWPKWGVAPGELTEHGGNLMEILGRWYREWLAKDGLLARAGCDPASTVYLRADTSQRTRESGRRFVEGMFPGCGIALHTVETDADPLFHSVAAGVGHGNAALASAAVSGRIGNHPEALTATLQPAFEALRKVLFGCQGGSACPGEKQPGKQRLPDLAATVAGSEDGLADIRGPVRTGSTLVENLLLEYADGMNGKDLGWGRLDGATLTELMAIHTTYADLARRTEYLARVQGSNLLNSIVRSMEQAVSGKAVPGALGKPGDRVLLLAGHDTNISHISGMLHLSWLLPGYQRDDTPPGGALVFRLWKQPAGGGYTVETLYIAQTLDQMREGTLSGTGSAPASAAIFVPDCPAAGPRFDCDWESFRQVAAGAIDSKYVGAN
jgi:4-phytase/acid phosphatase